MKENITSPHEEPIKNKIFMQNNLKAQQFPRLPIREAPASNNHVLSSPRPEPWPSLQPYPTHRTSNTQHSINPANTTPHGSLPGHRGLSNGRVRGPSASVATRVTCLALLLLLLLLLIDPAFTLPRLGGRVVTCVCTTAACRRAGEATCRTDAQCYAQRWWYGQGAVPSPVVRGCISLGDANSLLCMNQRPAGHKGSWPFLQCCHSHLCNRDVVPSMPTLPPVPMPAMPVKTALPTRKTSRLISPTAPPVSEFNPISTFISPTNPKILNPTSSSDSSSVKEFPLSSFRDTLDTSERVHSQPSLSPSSTSMRLITKVTSTPTHLTTSSKPHTRPLMLNPKHPPTPTKNTTIPTAIGNDIEINDLARLGVSSLEEFRLKYDQASDDCGEGQDDLSTTLLVAVAGGAVVVMVLVTVLATLLLLSLRTRQQEPRGWLEGGGGRMEGRGWFEGGRDRQGDREWIDGGREQRGRMWMESEYKGGGERPGLEWEKQPRIPLLNNSFYK